MARIERARARRVPKTVASAKLSRAGSKVQRTDHGDGVRRVVQCTGQDCGRTVLYRGDEALWAQGWGSSWKGSSRSWRCPGCYTPPPAVNEAPSYRVDAAMLKVAAEPIAGVGRQKLERQLVRLLNIDPKRGEAYLKAIVAHHAGKGGAGAVRWRALLELVPVVAAEGAQRKRRVPPVRPGKPLPERRRVVGEVASEVVAVRLTPTERRDGETLAEKMREKKLGPLLRGYLQCALGGILQPAAPTPPPTASGARVDRQRWLGPWKPGAAERIRQSAAKTKGVIARDAMLRVAEDVDAWEARGAILPSEWDCRGAARAAISALVEAIAVDDLEELADELAVALTQVRQARKATLGALLEETPREPPPPARRLFYGQELPTRPEVLAFLAEKPATMADFKTRKWPFAWAATSHVLGWLLSSRDARMDKPTRCYTITDQGRARLEEEAGPGPQGGPVRGPAPGPEVGPPLAEGGEGVAELLAVACGGCGAGQGERCRNAKGQPCRPHRARREADVRRRERNAATNGSLVLRREGGPSAALLKEVAEDLAEEEARVVAYIEGSLVQQELILDDLAGDDTDERSHVLALLWGMHRRGLLVSETWDTRRCYRLASDVAASSAPPRLRSASTSSSTSPASSRTSTRSSSRKSPMAARSM